MNKKSDKANLEKSKGLFFATGFAVVLLLFVLILEHKVPVNKQSNQYAFMGEPEFIKNLIIIEDSIQIPQTKNISGNDLHYSFSENNETIKSQNKSNNKIIKNEEIIGEKGSEITFFEHKKATFPGGTQSLEKYIAEQLKYPPKAKEKNIQGRVYISFTISKNGSILNPRIVNSSHSFLNNEALRLIKKMPKWHPAQINGTTVASAQTLSIVFKL